MSNSFSFTNQSALPNGVYCVLTGYVHTAATNTATVKDKNGRIVAQISGKGGVGTYVPMTTSAGSTNTFQPQSAGQPYSITFTKNSGDNDVQFLYAENAINSGTKTYCETYTFITEDYTDSDYNDATVYLTWNLTAG